VSIFFNLGFGHICDISWRGNSLGETSHKYSYLDFIRTQTCWHTVLGTNHYANGTP